MRHWLTVPLAAWIAASPGGAATLQEAGPVTPVAESPAGEAPAGEEAPAPEPLSTPGPGEPAFAELRKLRDPSELPEPLALRISDTGTGALVPLVEVLARRVIPPSELDAEQRLSSVQERCIHLALDRFERGAVLAAATEVLEAEALPEERRRAAWLAVLGTVGGLGELRASLEWAAAAEGEDRPLHADAAAGLRRGLAGMLAREPEAVPLVLEHWRTLGDKGLGALVLALGDARAPGGVAALTEVLRWRSDFATLVLAQLRAAGTRCSADEAEAAAAQVIEYLDAASPGVRRSASLALGALRAPSAVEALIAFLDVEDRGVREAAHRALTEIGATHLPPSPAAWRNWLRIEMAWDVDAVLARLDDVDRLPVGDAAALLRDVAEHPLHRRRTGAVLQKRLGELHEPARGLAIGALERLGVAVDPAPDESLVATTE